MSKMDSLKRERELVCLETLYPKVHSSWMLRSYAIRDTSESNKKSSLKKWLVAIKFASPLAS